MLSILPKYKRNIFAHKFLVGFLEELKTRKKSSEINWPLAKFYSRQAIIKLFEKQNQSWQPLNWCHPCVKHSNPMLFSSRIDIFSFPTSLIEGGKKDRLHLGNGRWVLAQAKPFHGRLGPKSILQRKSCLKMNKIDTCRYTVWTIDKQFIWILVWKD